MALPDYRLYFHDSQGRISKRFEFHCDDDEAARAVAETHRGKRPFELWQGGRFVAAFEPKERQT